MQQIAYKKIAVSIPVKDLDAIDKIRGDVPRSRFLVRLFKNSQLEKGGSR